MGWGWGVFKADNPFDRWWMKRRLGHIEFVGVNGEDSTWFIGKDAKILSQCILYSQSEIGYGAFLAHRVTVREHAVVGNMAKIGQNSVIEWGAKIGTLTKLQSFCLVAEEVEIGVGCFIGPHFCSLTDPYMDGDKRKYAPPIVGDRVRIGGGVTLLPGAKIGDGCIIGAGCVIDGVIPPNKVVYAKGVKGIVMRDIMEEDHA